MNKYGPLLLILLTMPAWAIPHPTDPRYCGAPIRYKNGEIKRSQSVLKAFERLYPLPAQFNRADWEVDHVIPLQAGGVDAIHNLQWLPKAIKTCAGSICKDRFERLIYAPKQAHTKNCEKE